VIDVSIVVPGGPAVMLGIPSVEVAPTTTVDEATGVAGKEVVESDVEMLVEAIEFPLEVSLEL
jgi:hypothetical protein